MVNLSVFSSSSVRWQRRSRLASVSGAKTGFCLQIGLFG